MDDMATQYLYPRFVTDQIRAALSDTPVVAVNGARQVGKSTLVLELLSTTLRDRTQFVTLDDRTQRDAAMSDPIGFVRREGLLVIDEVQRVPDLLPAVKVEVDRDRRPGRFLLTGSARLLAVPEMSESLAGRVEIIDLWPLSQGEISRHSERFVDAAFRWDPALSTRTDMTRPDYMLRVCAGGFPEPLERVGRRRKSWFANYSTTVLERMVSDIAHIDRLAAMPQLLRLCAARTANELNVRDVASDLGLPYRTVGAYLTHLQATYLVHLLPAWSRNLTSKVVRRPKVLITDTGLAAYLLGVDADALADMTAPAGPLLETFVVMELRKQLAWADVDATMYHWRDRGGAEVDIILQTPDGGVVGIEVKASSTARTDDFRGLRILEDKLGDRFKGGIVLYTGGDTVPFGTRLAAVPVAAIWSAG